MALSDYNPITYAINKAGNFVNRQLYKYGFASTGTGLTYGPYGVEPEPPYERRASPLWIYRVRRNNALVNNAIEEKVNQTFRRGFAEFETEYAVRCDSCGEEYETLEPFKEQLGEEGEEIDDEDIDFSEPRPCPNKECMGLVTFEKPDPKERERAEKFMSQVNHRGRPDQFLDGDYQNSVGQSFLEVCKEVAWDIQSFDDGWMTFEREYVLNQDGEIIDWDLKSVQRAPPELMRYSLDREGNLGERYWVCVKCRATEEDYRAQEHGTECEKCGGKTYRAYAEGMAQPRGDDPVEWFIRGEFAHGSEYEPGKYYGYSPILTLWEESRTLENMDQWYQSAYEQRRAPRGAMVIRSSNAESVRAWNQKQMEKLKADPNHIATFIDDTDGQASPITWQDLLAEPAEMQHMQMREWFLDRISAKYGVTAIFQTGSPSNSGLSQSMEIIVSNRSAHRLKTVYDDIFIPAFLSQLQIDGWTLEVEEPEEEDEMAKAQQKGKDLQNIRLAQQVGLDAEWTNDDESDIKPGMAEAPDEGMGQDGLGELGSLMGGDTEPGADSEGGRPYEAEMQGGAPHSRKEPTQGNEIQYSSEGGGGTVTSGDSGYSNPSYSEGHGVMGVLSHLREMLEEERDPKMEKKIYQQASKAFDLHFKAMGIDAESIEEHANDESKTFYDLLESNYGKWVKHGEARAAASYLYEMFGGEPQ